MASICPLHQISLTPLPETRNRCDSCNCVGSTAVLGCRECRYAVCKWCCVGGHRLFELVAQAETSLMKLRNEIAVVKARVDGDVFVWV